MIRLRLPWYHVPKPRRSTLADRLGGLVASVPMPDHLRLRWRVGEKVVRTLHEELDPHGLTAYDGLRLILFGYPADVVDGFEVSLWVDYGVRAAPCECGRTFNMVDPRSRQVGSVAVPSKPNPTKPSERGTPADWNRPR